MAHKFRTRSGFKQWDVFLKQEQWGLTKNNKFIWRRKYANTICLSYRIDLYSHDYKLAIEIDEDGHSNRNVDYKLNRQSAIEQELGCKFIRTVSEKFRPIKQPTKKL